MESGGHIIDFFNWNPETKPLQPLNIFVKSSLLERRSTTEESGQDQGWIKSWSFTYMGWHINHPLGDTANLHFYVLIFTSPPFFSILFL